MYLALSITKAYTGHEVTAFDTSSTAYSTYPNADNYNEATPPVTLSVREVKTGRQKQLQAKYVIGCDGGRSIVRKVAGIQLTDLGFDQPWWLI